MIKSFTIFLFILVIQTVYGQNAGLKTIADHIKIENLKEKVYILASDSFQGRKTYQKGQKDAARYISGIFKTHDLTQLEGTLNYYQVYTRYRLTPCFSHIQKKEDIGKKGKFLVSLSFSNLSYTDTSMVEYVLAGRATDIDLRGLDIKNKAIVFFVDSLKEGIKKVNQLSLKYPESKFVICMNDKRNYPRFENFFKQKLLKISDVKSFKDLMSYHSRLYMNELSKDKVDNAEFIPELLDTGRLISFSAIGEEQLESIFGIKAKKLYKITKKNQEANSNLLTGIPEIEIKQGIFYKEKIDTLTSENVIAFIEGTEKKDEAIILTAHYDHVGKKYKGGVCPGADDNASGTAALMEIAGAFADAQKIDLKPKRSVIFIAFTGEEEGLVGSWHYVNNPLFPLKNTICDINMDMVGRNHKDKEKNKDKVFLIGRNPDKQERKKTFKKINKEYDLLKLDTHPPFIPKIMWLFGSDHHAFQMKKIPSTVLFTGDHDDYHTPGDIPDKINYEKLAKISKLVFLASWELANQ